MKKRILCLLGLLGAASCAFAQIVTASAFFSDVSDVYAGLDTYTADITMNVAGRQMSGTVYFKRPQMLKIEFTQPAEQVVMFDGATLMIYLPGQETILQQTVTNKKDDTVSSRGLSLFRRYYAIAFENSATPVPLEEGNPLRVVNLILTRRAATEAFTSIKLSVEPGSKLIRRAVATTSQGQVYTFTFSNYSLNPTITDQRFMYDPPASANNYNNFLFQE